jgi:hypothetical protein
MARFGLMAAGFVAAMGLSLSSAQAVPAPKPATAAQSGNPLVEQVHGWHRYCAWGPRRFHRHIPGIGNVACRRRIYRRAPVIVVPRYRRPRVIVRPRFRGPRVIIRRGGIGRGAGIIRRGGIGRGGIIRRGGRRR